MGRECRKASRNVHYEEASDNEATESEAEIGSMQASSSKAP
jgi:hypothetical protein